MEETLRAARGIVRALWALCATTLLVVMQAAPTQVFEAASRELEALGRVSSRGYEEFVRSCVERDAAVAASRAALAHFMADARRPDAQVHAYALGVEQIPYEVYAPLAEQLTTASLTSILDRGSWTRVPTAAVIDATALKAFVDQVEPPLLSSAAELVNFSLADQSPQQLGRRQVSVHFQVNLATASEFKRPPGIEHFERGGDLWDARATLPAERREFPNCTFADWLRSDSQLELLVRAPAIKGAIWPEIKDQTYEEAVRYVRSRSDASDRTVSVFSVKIPHELIFGVSPALIVLVLVYLTSHVAHAIECAPGAREALATFPWFPLFPGALSRAVAHCSTWGLASATVGFVLWRSDRSIYALPVQLVSVLLALVVGFRLCRALRGLNARRQRALSEWLRDQSKDG